MAITITALFYTDHLAAGSLLLELIPLALFGFLVQRRITPGGYSPMALVAWTLVHPSGIHSRSPVS